MDSSKAKMGKLAQKFDLSQKNRKKDEQATPPGRLGQADFATNQGRPLQLPGSQVLRRNGGSDVPVMSSSTVGEPLTGHRSRHAQHATCLGASRGLVSKNNSSSITPMEIDSPETPTQEQRKILDLEKRLRVATQRVQDLEDDAKTHAEELLVARAQAGIEIDQEVVRLQQEVETLGEHEDRLIGELVASEAKLKGLRTKERDLKKRLSHFRTIYCLKHAYRDHLKKMNYIKQCTAKRLHDKFLETEGKYMEAAYDLYDYLEVNGLEKTLPSDVKAMLASPKGKKN